MTTILIPKVTEDVLLAHWPKEYVNVTKAWVNGTTNTLRFVMRDGKRILQQAYSVEVEFSRPVFKHGGMVMRDVDTVWFDVPLVEE